MTSEFDEATAVTPLGAGRFGAEVHPGWDIGGNTNGGYLLALVGRALSMATGRADAVSITAHYLRPCPAGPAEVATEVVRAGRRFTTATASLHQQGHEIIRVLATLGDLGAGGDGPTRLDGAPPELPPYDECPRGPSPHEGLLPTIQQRLALRLRPGDEGFRTGVRTGRAEIAGWFAFADGRDVDTLALLLAADGFPPAVFNTELPIAWVPTVELTVHVRAVPVPGPLRCVFRTRYLQYGLLEEDGELWDGAGRLVALSRQLALAPRAAQS